mmetsp:Transcript_8303/g.24554  ORF Transcript_8303/g.24554 Transcript_8303/m.24554 type:complete len:214 (+) Transcript_8303:1822-2463(+)
MVAAVAVAAPIPGVVRKKSQGREIDIIAGVGNHRMDGNGSGTRTRTGARPWRDGVPKRRWPHLGGCQEAPSLDELPPAGMSDDHDPAHARKQCCGPQGRDQRIHRFEGRCHSRNGSRGVGPVSPRAVPVAVRFVPVEESLGSGRRPKVGRNDQHTRCNGIVVGTVVGTVVGMGIDGVFAESIPQVDRRLGGTKVVVPVSVCSVHDDQGHIYAG